MNAERKFGYFWLISPKQVIKYWRTVPSAASEIKVTEPFRRWKGEIFSLMGLTHLAKTPSTNVIGQHSAAATKCLQCKTAGGVLLARELRRPTTSTADRQLAAGMAKAALGQTGCTKSEASATPCEE